MKTFFWILGIAASLPIIALLVGAGMSPEQTAKYGRQKAIEEKCEIMMADAAPGSEKRLVRQLCDGMKAEAAK